MPRQAWLERALDDPDYRVDTVQGRPMEFSGPLGGKAANATLSDVEIDRLTAEFVAKAHLVAARAAGQDMADANDRPVARRGLTPLRHRSQEPTRVAEASARKADAALAAELALEALDRRLVLMTASSVERTSRWQSWVQVARELRTATLDAFVGRALSAHLASEVKMIHAYEAAFHHYHLASMIRELSLARSLPRSADEHMVWIHDVLDNVLLLDFAGNLALDPPGLPDPARAPSEAALNLAQLLERQGNLQEAERWYRRANPTQVADAALGLAHVLERYGKLHEAEYWYRQAAAETPPKADLDLSEGKRRR